MARLAVLGALLLVACSSPRPVVQAVPIPPRPEPTPVAVTESGELRLVVEDAGLATGMGWLEARVVLPDGALLAAEPPVAALVTPDGTDRTPEHGGKWAIEPATGRLRLERLELGGADRIARLEVSLRILRVESWSRSALGGLTAGDEEALLAPPFQLETRVGTSEVAVTASITDRSLAAGGPNALLRSLGHRWAAGAVEVRDAERLLVPAGSSGDAGGTTALYRLGSTTRFPLSVELRVPQRYALEPVVFVLEEVVLDPASRRR
jgi:hypothetical protein